MERRKSLPVRVGNVIVGGGAPIVVESMTKTDTRDVAATVRQIRALERAGCELVRVAVPDRRAASSLGKIVSRSRIPIVADIHFDHRLALISLEEGVAGIRLNPGNITNRKRIEEVVRSAASKRVSIRIGVNAGSLPRRLIARPGGDAVHEAMVESAVEHIGILEDVGFRSIIVSVKSADVATTILANRELASRVDYPLHIGITESGTMLRGSVVSAAGIAILLSEGIGDAVRVSLAANPGREVEVAFHVLKGLGLRAAGPTVICCPTCGRCEIDIQKIAAAVERKVKGLKHPVRIAVMGCAVNGPGEARDADVGVAGGKGEGLLFRRGVIVGKVKEKGVVEALIALVRLFVEEETPGGTRGWNQ
ncbi:MAG: flavodoxin-dependent (E)-4-hydroxy-3-methylbut-2-enyl-diphosphate synthase [Candidatus Eisenbacteria bacterium]|nr:flavodoxin-dependent (E)-4-hydroxy-3-methylbut-2-enyl-diphosphate synthase [Candidatus Eisenbacteria bacterium]